MPNHIRLKFILVIAVLFASNELAAQTFRGVISVGANACQIDGDKLSGFHKPGYMLGVGVERSIYKRWSVLLGIEFMEKGSRTSSKDSMLYFKWKMHYIDIPVVLSFQAHQRFHFQLGIAPSLLVNEKIDIGFGYEQPPFKDDLLNVLIAPAVEYFPIDNVSLLLRYQYSLIRFNSQVPNTIPKFHNVITVGLRFYFGEKM